MPEFTNISRRATIGMMGGLAAAAAFVPGRASAQGSVAPVVVAGTPAAVIVVPDLPAAQVTSAAADLRLHIRLATGADLAVTSLSFQASLDPQLTRIWVGVRTPEPGELPAGQLDAFLIASSPSGIELVGASAIAVWYAAADFLERHVDVRWLLPTEVGTDVPGRSDVAVPWGRRVQVPVIGARRLSGITDLTWLMRNRSSSAGGNAPATAFHHSLNGFFPSATWGATHPEIYPMRNGVRYIPKPGVTSGWQPSFTLPLTVQIAVDRVRSVLTKDPKRTSVSLGVNDGGGFCESVPGQPGYTTKINSQGFPDHSDVYFSWLNKVATEVARTHPYATLGCLAYDELADAPSFRLHPSIRPFHTQDRFGWTNDSWAATDRQHIRNWRRVTDNLAWYDYTYGGGYAAPRIYLDTMQQYHLFGAANGLKEVYSEIYPMWGIDGPKPWVYTRLMWNPRQDPQALLREWCTRAVGSQAGPAIFEYYSWWERFWTGRMPRTHWFDVGKGSTYFVYQDASFLQEVSTPEATHLSSLFDRAQATPMTEPQRARFDVLASAFGYVRDNIASYPRRRAVPNNEGEAVATVAALAEGPIRAAAAQRRFDYVGSVAQNPLLKFISDHRSLGEAWSGWSADEFWGLADYVTAKEAGREGVIRAQLQDLATGTGDLAAMAALVLATADGTAHDAAVNSGFESGEDVVPTAWKIATPYLEAGTVHRFATPAAFTGDHVLRIRGIFNGLLNQSVPVVPGPIALQARFRVLGDHRFRKGNVLMLLRPQSADGKILQTRLGIPTMLETPGQTWQRISMCEVLPAAINGQPVTSATVQLSFNNQLAEPEYWIDSFQAFQLPTDGN